jgi:hypothetical protein
MMPFPAYIDPGVQVAQFSRWRSPRPSPSPGPTSNGRGSHLARSAGATGAATYRVNDAICAGRDVIATSRRSTQQQLQLRGS